jgi:hypothetical protein
VGGKFSYRGVVSDRLIKDRFIADAAAKCEIGFEAGCEISGLGRTFKAGACRGVKVAYDCDARAMHRRASVFWRSVGRGRASFIHPSAAACPSSGGRTPTSFTTARRPRTRTAEVKDVDITRSERGAPQVDSILLAARALAADGADALPSG